MWGIHNDQSSLDLVSGGFVSIGWEELGDVRELDLDRESLKLHLAATYPAVKPGAIPVWAGVLIRFIEEIAIGDYVISPNKADRTLNFGTVESGFYVEEGAEVHPNRRRVKWLHTGVPRDTFSKSALHEIGSAMTLFRVANHRAEFLQYIESGSTTPVVAEPGDPEVELAEDEPNAERVDTYSRDFVVDILRHMDAYRFEHFIAGLLNALGYRATATMASGDGGVDVIASRDALGIEPPIIKVQCKRTISTIGGPDVQKLAGALAHGGSELGLFVTLGSYSTDARHLERTRQDLRLINGSQLVDLIFEHYEHLDAEWKRLLPLRRVYAVDRDAGGS
ncbi:MAG: restriction endonuclease [Acidimicrobiia bacterium]|nr:restriction endonuclease [Acidimicrobiia bacterium]